VVFDLVEGGKDLIINGVVINIYRNSILSRVAVVPGFAANHVKDN